MKVKLREYENKEYFEYLKESLYLIIHRKEDGPKTISRIQNKLKGVDLEIFNSITLFYTAIRIGHIRHQSALSEYRKVSLNEQIINDNNIFESINKSRLFEKECQKALDDYLKSIGKSTFLSAISEIAYWIAKIEGTRQITIHKEFLATWASWHRYLERKNRSKREGQKVKEKLRLILGDAVDNFGKIEEAYTKNIERFEAGGKNIFVNIDYEIDLSKAISNEQLILPTRWLGEKEDFRIIEENTLCVEVDDKKYTLKDYYELVKNNIDSEWLVSKDLLKQIITIYLIKRCHNGDEIAFQKLFDLYKKKAEKVAKDFVRTRKGVSDIEFLEGRELTILKSLLKGDQPAFLYKTLDQGRFDKKDIDSLNKKPYIALNESYEYLFILISNQYNYLNGLLIDLEKGTKDFRSRLKKVKKEETRKGYYRKVFLYSQHTLSRVNSAPTIFAILNPIDLLKISPNYNKFLFKPTPNGNLTTWLFGSGKKGEFKGMVWESLSNLTKSRKTKSSDESYDDNEYEIDKEGFAIRIGGKQKDE